MSERRTCLRLDATDDSEARSSALPSAREHTVPPGARVQAAKKSAEVGIWRSNSSALAIVPCRVSASVPSRPAEDVICCASGSPRATCVREGERADVDLDSLDGGGMESSGAKGLALDAACATPCEWGDSSETPCDATWPFVAAPSAGESHEKFMGDRPCARRPGSSLAMMPQKRGLRPPGTLRRGLGAVIPRDEVA
eukprot:scaffold79247_cov30-Tisochrysis_lutea.AAC.2